MISFFVRQRPMAKLIGILLVVLSQSNAAIADTSSNRYELPDIVALQTRDNYLNKGFTFSIGYLPSDAFNKGLIFGGSYTHFFTDYFAWEIVNGQYAINFETSLKDDLINNFPLEIENVGFDGRLDHVQYYATSNVLYTPFFTKSLLFDDAIVLGEMSFLFGGGVVRFEKTGIKPLIDTGLYLRYFLGQSSSLKFDFRVNFYHDQERGLGNFLSFIIGYSMQLGDPPVHLQESVN
jgi:outer membrane beta-barrel protein